MILEIVTGFGYKSKFFVLVFDNGINNLLSLVYNLNRKMNFYLSIKFIEDIAYPSDKISRG